MSRRLRVVLGLVAGCGLGAALLRAFLLLPPFGAARHPYGERALHAGLALRRTANVVAAVTFDQRGADTLVEEFIFFASVVGVLVLLRPAPEERRSGEPVRAGHVLESTRLVSYLLLPVTMLVGAYVVVHGHVSPGGGFQGGVVLGTALHLMYLGGDYPALRRLRPTAAFEVVESVGAAGFAVVGLAGTLAGGAFLVNLLPPGTFRDLLSAGTVPVLNLAVGMEVAAGSIVLLTRFFEQDLELRGDRGGPSAGERP